MVDSSPCNKGSHAGDEGLREGTETLPYKLRGFCGILRVVGDADPYKGAIEYARGKSMDFADYGNNQRIDSTVCTAMRGL